MLFENWHTVKPPLRIDFCEMSQSKSTKRITPFVNEEISGPNQLFSKNRLDVFTSLLLIKIKYLLKI